MKSLAIILTVRTESERLPGKVVAEVEGKPLAYWIATRLKQLGQVIVATTDRVADDVVESVGRSADVPVYRGANDDVVGRMEAARMMYAPDAEYVLRALGDCPFMATGIIERAVNMMAKTEAEAFQWHLAPNCHPVYGAREFPYHADAWRKVVTKSKEREHVDMYFHQHRDEFCVVYHEPPPNVYFRGYRLEVDWPEDLELIRRVAASVGMLAPLSDVIAYLDENQGVANLNHERVERTGLSVSFDYNTQREWMRAMEGRPVVSWNDTIWYPPSAKAMPVFCQSGRCLLGYAFNGVLYTKTSKIRGEAQLDCSCGSGKIWNAPRGRGTRDLGGMPSGSVLKLL